MPVPSADISSRNSCWPATLNRPSAPSADGSGSSRYSRHSPQPAAKASHPVSCVRLPAAADGSDPWGAGCFLIQWAHIFPSRITPSAPHWLKYKDSRQDSLDPHRRGSGIERDFERFQRPVRGSGARQAIRQLRFLKSAVFLRIVCIGGFH